MRGKGGLAVLLVGITAGVCGAAEGIRPQQTISVATAPAERPAGAEVEAVALVATDEILSANIKEADGVSGQNTETGSGIKSGHLQNGAVTGPKLANGAVGKSKLAKDAVTADKVAFYTRTAIIASAGGDFSNPATALESYGGWCGEPSPTNRCLLKIMPGIYDVGSTCVNMQGYIDLEGSGENTTVLQGTGVAVVCGATDAELRLLTVEAMGGGPDAVAIANDAGAAPRITQVTARASGGARNVGINNHASSSPTLSNVTALATGGTYSYGVNNEFSSSPAMTNVTATASGASSENFAIRNSDSSAPTLVTVTATASGSGSSMNIGVSNNSSNPSLNGVTATASGGMQSVGVDNVSSSPEMLNVRAVATDGGARNIGVANTNASPFHLNVKAVGSGGGSSENFGITNTGVTSAMLMNVFARAFGGSLSCGVGNSSSSFGMTGVRAHGSNGTSNYGLCNGDSSGTIKIDNSVLIGSTNTILNGAGVKTLVGNSKLDGGPVRNDGLLIKCAGVYDENYTFYSNTCP